MRVVSTLFFGGGLIVLPEQSHRHSHTGHGLSRLPYVLSAQVGMAFGVGKLPYAILIDELGVIRAKGIVNTREHLESLFEAQRRGVASIQEFLQAEGEAA